MKKVYQAIEISKIEAIVKENILAESELMMDFAQLLGDEEEREEYENHGKDYPR